MPCINNAVPCISSQRCMHPPTFHDCVVLCRVCPRLSAAWTPRHWAALTRAEAALRRAKVQSVASLLCRRPQRPLAVLTPGIYGCHQISAAGSVCGSSLYPGPEEVEEGEEGETTGEKNAAVARGHDRRRYPSLKGGSRKTTTPFFCHLDGWLERR